MVSLPLLLPSFYDHALSGTSPLLNGRPRLTLVGVDRVEHDLDGVLRSVVLVALAPVVGYGVGEDVSGFVKGRGDDATADVGVAFETVLGILVPEVEGSVGAGGAEGAVDRVEGDVVYGVDGNDVVLDGVTMALEGEIGSVRERMLEPAGEYKG